MTAAKRLLPVFVAIIMVFAMMPMTAGTVFAESDVDTTRPEVDIDSFTVTLPEGKDKVTVGDKVTFSVKVSDDRGIEGAFVDFLTPVTKSTPRVILSYAGTDQETKNGTWTGEFTITDSTENGIWQILEVGTYDINDNWYYHYNSKIHEWGNAHSDLSAFDFEVSGTNADPDITRPEVDIDSFTVTLPEGKDKVTVGDKVTFSVKVSDDRGIEGAFVDFLTPVTESTPRVNLSYAGTDQETKNGTWTGEFTITDSAENGIWQILEVGTYDINDHWYYHYNSKIHEWGNAHSDLSAFDFEVTSPECPLDLTTEGYSMMLDGAGATTTFGGNYYINTADGTVTPTVKVRFDADDGTWTTLAPRKYTLKYEKKTGNDSWEDYTADTFGVNEDGTATYRVSATGKESLSYTGTVGPVEFNVIKKYKVTFDSHGGSGIDPQYLIPGERATEPAKPTKDGRYFTHWYSDEGLTQEYRFGNPVSEEITLHAGWLINAGIGIYNQSNPDKYRCGTIDIASVSQEYSYTDATTMNYTLPEGSVTYTAKPAEGYTFKGWYKGIYGDSYYIEKPSDTLISDQNPYTTDSVDGVKDLCAVFECREHDWQLVNHKATFTDHGYQTAECSVCGATDGMTIGAMPVDTVKLAKKSYVYTGKAIQPEVTLASSDGPLSEEYYTVTYSNNVKVGTAKVTVTLKGDYYEGTKDLTFKITKAANPLKIGAKKAPVKFAKLKKKNQTLAVTKVIKFTKDAKDKKTYTFVSVKKGSKSFKKYFKINKTTGKLTVKKGLKKGVYKVKVKVKAAGNANYKASAVKTVAFKIMVK